MGLRRTPPPGMAALPQSSQRVDYMTEYPEQPLPEVETQPEAQIQSQSQSQTQAQVQVEATPTPTSIETTMASPVPASQVQSSSQVFGTPIEAASASDTTTDKSIATSAPHNAASTALASRISPPIKSLPTSATSTPPPPSTIATVTATTPHPQTPFLGIGTGAGTGTSSRPQTTAAGPSTTPRPQTPAPNTSTNTTPHRNLLTLAAGLNRPPPTTPRLRPNPSARRTPGAHRLAPRSPHALRAFSRRAATPRRKSNRFTAPPRESPRDWLLKLGAILAPTTAPFVPTPVQTPRVQDNEELYFSDPEEERPSTVVNFYEDGDEDGELIRPEDPSRSIERGRRAVSEQPWGGRMSFGMAWEDRFADLEGLRETGEEEEEQAEVGQSTVGDVSIGAIGRDITLGAISIGDISVAEPMAFQEEEEEDHDVTMGLGDEPQFDEGDSYFLPMPEGTTAGNLDLDVDSDSDGPIDHYSPLGHDPELPLSTSTNAANRAASKSKRTPHPLSRHGHPLPPFSRATIKKLAQRFAGGAAIGPEALNAIVAASDAFFEQVGEDLGAYARHAGRKTVEEGDVVLLLGRQRQTGGAATLFSLAQRHLPRELLQEVRMPLMKAPKRGGGGKKGKGKAVEVEDESEE